MFCKNFISHKNKTFLYKKWRVETTFSDRKRYVGSNALYCVSKRKVSNGNIGIKDYILHSSNKQNAANSGFAPLRTSGILQANNILYLNLDCRFLHGFISSAILGSGTTSGYFRWKSTNVNERSKDMPGISVNPDEILRNSSPITVTTEKILNVLYEDNEETRHILTLYPHPKSVLHNIFDIVSNKNKNSSLKLTPEYSTVTDQNKTMWVSIYHVYWPEEIRFSAVDLSKASASNKAALIALTWLKNNGRITDTGRPIIHVESKVKDEFLNTCDQNRDIEQIIEFNPSLKELLQNVFLTVANVYCDDSYKIEPVYNVLEEQKGHVWNCVYRITWPNEKQFSASDLKKELAEHKAASEILHWLKNNGNITQDNVPIIEISYEDSEETRQMLKLYPSAEIIFFEITKQTNSRLTVTSQFHSKGDQNEVTSVRLDHVSWPYVMIFLAGDVDNNVAMHKAAVTALFWLNRQKKITVKNRPLIPEIYYRDIDEYKNILIWYADPVEEIDEVFKKLTNKIDKKLLMSTYDTNLFKDQNLWLCLFHMHWPEEMKFLARDETKLFAKNKAAAVMLTWLKNYSDMHNISQINEKLENKQIQNKIIGDETVRVKEIYYTDTEKSKQIAKQFSAPKSVLHNVFQEVSRQTNNKSLQLNPHYKLLKEGKKSAWLCTYHLYWPEEIKFLAEDSKKSVASHKAAVAALAWLRDNHKITQEGLPVIYNKEQIKAVTKKSLPVLMLDKSTIDKMKNIIQLHHSEIVPHIIKSKLEKAEKGEESEGELETITELKKENFAVARRQKYLGLDKYLAKEKVELPIARHKNDLINTMKNNQIVIVKGEPGCGKSTRVPQYVLEAWAKEDGFLGEPGRIAVTQPRRIAAISLAQRVAIERDEAVGQIVGYQVRLKSDFNLSTGRVLYCTTGILLRHFQSDPNLNKFSHIILDEAHERDVNTDLLMNLLRTACKTNPKLKLIVMSATIDTSMFSNYFGGAPIVEIPGFTYPVEQHFLDSNMKVDVSKTLSMCEGNIPSVIHEDVARVIQYIHKNKKEGAILCFLPGWDDIHKVQKLIPLGSDLAIYCLHSRLNDSDQWKIFSKPPPGIRKIILATNIAETSVTIDDVVYVVDTGIHKEQRFDVEKGVNCIDNHWISKASCNQRKGRAGRVQPGECFHLYTRDKYKSFPDYSLPEILRTSLTKIVLDSKVFSNNMNAVEFMSKLPTPPEKNTTLRAVAELKDLEMLNRDENLTSLGTTCAYFQLEPKFSKALINAVIFKCVTPMVDIVTLFSADSEFFTTGLSRKEEIKKMKQQFCMDSDHLAMMRLFEKWLEYFQEGDSRSLNKLCEETNLVSHKMHTIEQLRKIHYDWLYNGLYDVLPISDDFSDNDEMVKAVLYSGVGTVLLHRNWDIVKNKLKQNVNCLLTRNNHRATITTESVNHKKNKFPTSFLLYINETRSNIRRTTLVRECSVIPNISVLLFSNKDFEINYVNKDNLSKDIPSQDQVKVSIKNTNIELLCDRKQAQDLLECKNSIMAAYRYYIEQLTNTGVHNPAVNRSWDSILNIISDILSIKS